MEIKTSGGIHIGDGVYVRWDGYHLVLMANSPTTDTIYLDHHVRAALVRVIEQVDGGEAEDE